MRRKILLFLGLCLAVIILQGLPAAGAEEGGYLDDSVKIMMRSGDGFDYRILAMPALGQPVTILEKKESWIKVRTSDGKEGWVSSQFVGYDVPYRLRFEDLEKQYTEISGKLSGIQEENSRLQNENQTLRKRIETEVGTMTTDLEKLNRENRVLRDAAANRFIKWFLAGAGVLLFGFIVGYSVKRSRRQSYFI